MQWFWADVCGVCRPAAFLLALMSPPGCWGVAGRHRPAETTETVSETRGGKAGRQQSLNI